MKAFSISNGKVIEGIPTKDLHIVLGEQGRGRTLVAVPLPTGSTVDSESRLVRLLGQGILLRIEDHSGFRGGWELQAVEGATEVAKGACAQGIAGRMGGGADLLLCFAGEGKAEIKRSGKLYGAPKHLMIEVTLQGVTVTDVEAETASKRAGTILAALTC